MSMVVEAKVINSLQIKSNNSVPHSQPIQTKQLLASRAPLLSFILFYFLFDGSFAGAGMCFIYILLYACVVFAILMGFALMWMAL